MSAESIARRVAAKVYFAELAAARALGHEGIDAYVSAFRAMDSAYYLARSVEMPYIWQAAKTITGRR